MANHFKNATEVDALKPPVDTPMREHWHSTEKGFGVRVGRRTKSGDYSKIYLARYSVEREDDPKGKKKDVKKILGNVADIAYRDAFRLAQEHVQRARDLAGDIKAGRPRAATVRDCYDAYCRANESQWAEHTIKGYAKQFKNMKLLWDKKMDALGNEEWLNHYLSISTNHGRSTALGMMRLGSAMYAFQITLGKLDKNPCAALNKTKLVVKNKPRTRHVPRRELPAFWTALQTRAAGPQRDLILWVLFTGFRASLAGNLKWSRINVPEKTYRIDPADIGNKAKDEFHYPIPQYLWDTVITPRMAVRHRDDEYVIESTKKPGTPLHSVRGTYSAIAKVTGLTLSQHDIRRSFASFAHAATGDIMLTKRLMTHGSSGAKSRDAGTTESYIQTEAWQFREAVELAAAKILEFAKPTTKGVASEVEVVPEELSTWLDALPA